MEELQWVIIFLGRKRLTQKKNIVIKLGSNTLISTKVDELLLASLAKQVRWLRSSGYRVTIVSSGAVGLGRNILGWNGKLTIGEKQCAAAVGQHHIMQAYAAAFVKENLHVSQVLVTADDLKHRQKSIRELLDTFTQHNIIAIINENDSTSTQELTFGDNDALSAHVANLINADLVLLSNIDGLYTCMHEKHIAHNISIADCGQYVASVKSDLGTGGMTSKIIAAGINKGMTVLANGKEQDVIRRIIAGEDLGTLFHK